MRTNLSKVADLLSEPPKVTNGTIGNLITDKSRKWTNCLNKTADECYKDYIIGGGYSNYNHRYYFAIKAFLNALQSCSETLLRQHFSRTGFPSSAMNGQLQEQLMDEFEDYSSSNLNHTVKPIEFKIIVNEFEGNWSNANSTMSRKDMTELEENIKR